MTAGRRRGPDPARIVNYTTEVPLERTLNEIKAILRAHNARSLTEVYDGAKVSAIEFVYETGWGPRPYQLPIRPDAVLRVMVERRNQGKSKWDRFFLQPPWEAPDERSREQREKAIPQSMRDQAERTAWRTVKDWIEAQLALMATTQVTFEQIFLPYALVDGDRTMFEVYDDTQKRLPAAGQGVA